MTDLAEPLPGLTARVRERLARSGNAADAAVVADAVREEARTVVLGPAALRSLAARTHQDLVGLGPLAPLLADPSVTDVLVNGADEVWVDRGAGLERVPVRLGTAHDVRLLAQRLAAAGGRRLDDASPCADVRLADGTRLHAVLPPIAIQGPYLSIRTFRRRPYTLAELTAAGTVPAPVAEVLGAIVAARLAYLVAGGTGAGKTTLLNTMLGLVPRRERIVLVEDSAELHPVHPHTVSLQARVSNVEGAGGVTLRDLVRQALRMRPDRLVVGECRGAEVVDLLAALNTGHDGGASTVHANAPTDVPARLEALGLLGGLPRAALHAQVAAALQVVVQVRRTPTGRRVDELCLLLPGGPSRLVTAVPAWRHGTGLGPAASALARLLDLRGVRVPRLLCPDAVRPPGPASTRSGASRAGRR